MPISDELAAKALEKINELSTKLAEANERLARAEALLSKGRGGEPETVGDALQSLIQKSSGRSTNLLKRPRTAAQKGRTEGMNYGHELAAKQLREKAAKGKIDY